MVEEAVEALEVVDVDQSPLARPPSFPFHSLDAACYRLCIRKEDTVSWYSKRSPFYS